MKIRIAEQKDLKEIVNIYNQAIIAGRKTADIKPLTVEDRQEWFNDHKPEKYPVFVAEENNKILGYMSLSPYRPGRGALRFTAEVSYYIHSDFQNKGIASDLMEHTIKKAKELKLKTLFAIVLEGNEGSIALLKKYGFEQWGHLPQVADFDGIELGHLYFGLKMG